MDNQLVLSNTLISSLNLTNTLNLGAFVAAAFPFHGVIDEARLQFGLASPAWLSATYANMADNASFVGFAGAPTLTITPISGGYQISWSAESGPAQLVTTTSLNPPIDWTPVTPAPTLQGGQDVVQVTAQPGVAHFSR